MSVTPRPWENSIEVWDEPPDVIALTPEAIHSKRFETSAGREKAVDQLHAGVEPRSALGLLTKTIPLDAVRYALVVADIGVLIVQGSPLKDPLRLKLANTVSAMQIFEGLRDRLRELSGRTWDLHTCKATIHDVPFDPQLLMAVVLGGLGILALVSGAMEGVPIEGPVFLIALAWLGEQLGKAGSFILAGVALAAGVYLCIRWARSLPAKLFIRREA